jgi:demethylmenaquinone methyltransferase/2-methoxy-6-polyprenyl-1,4-benzoquinol methylase
MEDVLKEQLTYYNARAREYDESLQGVGSSNAAQAEFEEANQEWLHIVNALHILGPVEDVLELACGTGIWTQELMTIGASITAIDGSWEMIEINRAKSGAAAIDYECVDLFNWEPKRQYDLVFFAFWLSHVPPSHLPEFLSKVARTTKPGGRVFIVDEPRSDSNISGPNIEDLYQERTLNDGRTFRIVKVYHDPQEIARELEKQGFKKESSMIGRIFFYLCLAHTI